ncbi:hypothetical protein [Liquorilactobacillus nagelii]|uniref:hypothetical protein n=1 Tax=Liquorilactobacillus nagelii TaxID=82688 RepID=UPI0006EF0A1B|nr:hypothetical protein [Liquorilactobacillus nagelii]KRL40776.1 hypothetical protein FD45_GL001423 [Liquorilactobacillus nagelii DSM 13675]MCI1699462.1 hypothetical protein [Liquorilactobacillus nagelii]QYH53742.1 hypothetical protein G6O73_03105 [Liquorilactobacillus nagelii DSM 13675]
MKSLFKFYQLNEPQILMICGFLMLSIGAFKTSIIVGWFVTGSLFIVLALLSAWMAGRG